jgi:Rod binding domain-containing protein
MVPKNSHDRTDAMIHSLSSALPQLPSGDSLRLMEKAQATEAAFLAEMLAYSGLDESSDQFGGGTGEDQFASFLRQEQARLMVVNGGIGLARIIFQSLTGEEG